MTLPQPAPPAPRGSKLGWYTVTTSALSPEVYERFEAVRKRRNPMPSKSALIAEAVRYWLEEHEG
jgi:hypothetical protein